MALSHSLQHCPGTVMPNPGAHTAYPLEKEAPSQAFGGQVGGWLSVTPWKARPPVCWAQSGRTLEGHSLSCLGEKRLLFSTGSLTCMCTCTRNTSI